MKRIAISSLIFILLFILSANDVLAQMNRRKGVPMGGGKTDRHVFMVVPGQVFQLNAVVNKVEAGYMYQRASCLAGYINYLTVTYSFNDLYQETGFKYLFNLITPFIQTNAMIYPFF
jgi:hypothetical protein